MPARLLTKVAGTSEEMLDRHYDHSTAMEALAWMDLKMTPTANGVEESDPKPEPIPLDPEIWSWEQPISQ